MQVVWDLDKGEALCGAPLLAMDVRCFLGDAQRFATCGSDSSLFVWQLHRDTRKLTRLDIQVCCNASRPKRFNIQLVPSDCIITAHV